METQKCEKFSKSSKLTKLNSVRSYPEFLNAEKRNHLSFVNISPTLVIDTFLLIYIQFLLIDCTSRFFIYILIFIYYGIFIIFLYFFYAVQKEVDYYKARDIALNARSIKKVMEARVRKQRRFKKTMMKVMKKAENMQGSSLLTEYEKQQEIKK